MGSDCISTWSLLIFLLFISKTGQETPIKIYFPFTNQSRDHLDTSHATRAGQRRVKSLL